MTAPYYALFTDIGVAKLANATATDTPLNITDMGVGDGNGTMPTPDPSQTTLINERRREPLNSLSVDPNNKNQIIAEQVLPDDVGGWWIRELGLYDDDGDLIAVGNCPPSYKPLLEEGAGREQVIRIILIVSSDDAVTLKIDPAVVLATRQYVDDAIESHAKSRNHPDATTKDKGLVKLNSATNSDSETEAATPKAVKEAMTVANGAVKSINEHEPDKDGNVKLGSAADADIVTSMTDMTEGRLPVTGWMGLGGGAITMSNNELLSKSPVGSRIIIQGNGGGDNHFGTYGAGIHLDYGLSSDDSQCLSANMFVGSDGNLCVEWLTVSTADGSVVTHHFQKLFSPLNPPTAAQVGAMPYFGTAMSMDLNTLGAYSAAGVYYQELNASATVANHYPVAEAGTLLVTPSAYGCQQEYTTFSSGRKFVRGLTGAWNGSDGPWGVWTEILSTTEGDTRYQPKGNYTPEGQAYTKTESDARYIQNVQRGAAVTPPKANEYGPNEAPAGCVLTRAWHDPDTAYGVFFTYRPLQIFINGAWRTIAG